MNTREWWASLTPEEYEAHCSRLSEACKRAWKDNKERRAAASERELRRQAAIRKAAGGQ